MSGIGWKRSFAAFVAIVSLVVVAKARADVVSDAEAVVPSSGDAAGPSSTDDSTASIADDAATASNPDDAASSTADTEREDEGEEGMAVVPAMPHAFRIGGYVETFYQWNFNVPSNDLTAYRGFDNRHNTFTIANVALDTSWDYANVVGRLTLQVGSTPSSYYLAEPSRPGSSSVNASNADLWKYIQQAYVGYRIPVGGGLTVTAGVYLSPIGPETMPIHLTWNWSRSDLFFGLPFYHTGVRATYALDDAMTIGIAAYNGWNSVVDDNEQKSLAAHFTYAKHGVSLSLLYFTGVERPKGAPEGPAWRHLFDAYAMWNANSWLSLGAHANAGFEPNNFGSSRWVAGALYARARVLPTLFVAVRGDGFAEHTPSNAMGSATPIFWPAPWVSSATATLDYRPHAHVSIRLEFRHDQAGAPLYFGGDVVGNGTTMPYVPNRKAQNTVTIGATTWL